MNQVKDSETQSRQQKIQKLEQLQNIEENQESHFVEMMPPILNHRCKPSPRLSPQSIEKSVITVKNGLFSETLMKSVDLQTRDGSDKEEKGDNSTNEYDEMCSPMDIDIAGDAKFEDSDAKNVGKDINSIKAFCPSRVPRRSAMKRSGRSQTPSPLITKRALGDTFQIIILGCTEPVERRRTITFANDINVLKVEPLKSLLTDGSNSIWYQDSEYQAIKFKTLALLDRVDHSSGIVDGKKYCTRGLEKFMAPETTEVKKHQAWDSVLNEQFLQRKDGEYDEEAIANIYKYSTTRSKKEALRLAKIDAEAAAAYLETNHRTPSPSFGFESQPNFDRRVSL